MSADRLSVGLMLGLSFSTGVLDAATYLGLDGIFIANMTGNVVFVGLGIGGDPAVPLLRALLALGGFVAGAFALGLVQRGREPDPNADGVAAATFAAAGLLVAGAGWVLASGDLDGAALDAVTSVLACALGAQAVGARRVGVGDVSTVVVTSTLAGLASEAPWTGARVGGRPTFRRLAAVLSMGGGAAVGALLLRVGLALPVSLAGGVMLAVGLVTAVRVRRRATAGGRPRRAAHPRSG